MNATKSLTVLIWKCPIGTEHKVSGWEVCAIDGFTKAAQAHGKKGVAVFRWVQSKEGI